MQYLKSVDNPDLQALIEAADIKLISEGPDKYRILTPYEFPDGDGYVIVLKKEGDHWIYSDEGHTLMHMSLWMEDIRDILKGNSREIFENIISAHNLKYDEGEIKLAVRGSGYDDALIAFTLALSEIIDLAV